MSEIASISRYGKTEPFGLQVARGQVAWHSVLHIFGYNPDVDSGSEVTVWTAGGLLTHPASPTIMTVSSSSANDSSNGTGARTVQILGVNGTGEYVTETVTLNGQTAVNTTKAYDAIERITVLTVGSGGVNAGNINVGTGVVTAGVPATIYGQVGVGDNISLTGHWTCPVGYTGYMVSGSISSSTESGSNYITGRLKLRSVDGIVRTAAIVTLANSSADFNFDYPIKISAGECVTATVVSTANNEAVSSYFQIVLIKDSGE
jgi:hypothetical protein